MTAQEQQLAIEEITSQLDAEHAKDGSETPWVYFTMTNGDMVAGTFRYNPHDDVKRWEATNLVRTGNRGNRNAHKQ